MAAPSAIVNELASTGPTVEISTAPGPPAMDGTINPALLQITAPQPMQLIAFGTAGLAEHAFVPPAVQPMPTSAKNTEKIEPDTELSAGVDTLAISEPTPASSQPPRKSVVSAPKPARPSVVRPPPPPRPTVTRSYSTRSSPFGRPIKTRTERGKRTPQACERCRYRKMKCDGVHPSCDRCTKLRIKCAYVLDHKAVRSQLRKLQKEGLLPESIPLGSGSGRVKSYSAPETVVSPESAPGGEFAGHPVDGSSGASDHPSYVLSQAQAAGRPWARAPKRAGVLPQRLAVPMLSSGSSSGSSSGNTPLVTPTDEGPFQLGAIPTGFAVLFGPAGAPHAQGYGAYKQATLGATYPPPIMPYPGRSFPLMTTSGEYFDEARLVPELCGGVPLPAQIAIPANAYIVPHAVPVVNPASIKARAIWMDASVPGLRQDPSATVWAELFGREQ